jgi:hypothetical protein
MEKEILLIKHASDLLSKDMMDVGIYGKQTTAFKKNEAKKEVAKHIKRNAEAICKLIYEDKNVYLEKSKHHQNELLNQFTNTLMSDLDIETYKLIKARIGHFLNNL